MATKTYDMGIPAYEPQDAKADNNMFAQSAAFYSRVNTRKSSSKWMYALPVAAVLVVGGAVALMSVPAQAPVKSSTSHVAVQSQPTSAPAPVAAVATPDVVKPVAVKPDLVKSVTIKRVETRSTVAPSPVAHTAERRVTTSVRTAPVAPTSRVSAAPTAPPQTSPVPQTAPVTISPSTPLIVTPPAMVTPAPDAAPAPSVPDAPATPPQA